MPPPPIATDPAPLTVTREQVRQSIVSMPTGSAGGMDGIRPIHLRQLTSSETGEAGQRLLTSITALTNLVLAGQVPSCARDALYCASLCASRKRDGGLRPIAVGSIYRRLPARIAARFAATVLGPELRPIQLGVGTPLGCEAAVHAARSFTAGSDADQTTRVLVKLDVKNAFNSVRRDIVLRCIKERCPEAYAMAYQAYITPTPLFIAGHTIISSAGVQQGDPLGPIAFALAVDTCARNLQSPLNIWYLDDATIGGPVSDVVADLRLISKALPDLGLQLNAAKCEVAVLDDPGREQHASAIREVKSILPEVSETPLTRLRLLGSPLHEEGLPDATDMVLDTISMLCERVRYLDRHTGLFFLAHHVSAPRLIYLLRSAPLYSASSSLRKIDELVKSTLADVTNFDISGPAWDQASLPRRHGGLGVRSVETLALPCYVASLYATAPLLSAITLSDTDDVTQAALGPALEDFRLSIGLEDIPVGQDARKQRLWDDLACKKVTERLLKTANQIDRARLLAASSPHTADWLQAIPASNLGLHLDADTVRVAVALRLGVSICEPHHCSQCGHPVDSLGHHGLSCKKSAGRFPRHASLNDVVKRALASAGVPSILEPQGLDRGDGRRQDGLTLFPFKQGKSLTWDATCVDTFAESAVVNASLEPGSAAKAAEDRKEERYSTIAQRHIFIPVAVETTGVLGPAAAAFLSELGRRITDATGDRREVSWLRQRVSLAVIRGNAAAVLSTTRPAQGPQNNILSQQNRPHAHLGKKSRPQGSTPAFTAARSDCRVAVPAGKVATIQRRRGLLNLGNTCYMNAGLQALFHTDELRSEVLAARSTPSQPHLAALQRVLAFLAFSDRPTYSPDELQRVALPPWFKQCSQQDCAEFLGYLLDMIHEEDQIPERSVVSATPLAALPPVRTAACHRTRDDISMPGPAVPAADRPQLRRRHRSCDASRTRTTRADSDGEAGADVERIGASKERTGDSASNHAIGDVGSADGGTENLLGQPPMPNADLVS